MSKYTEFDNRTEMDGEEDEAICNETGQCKAPDGARDIANCIFCGKELEEKNGEWWTWDADFFSEQRPQGSDT